MGVLEPPREMTASQFADEECYLITASGRSVKWETREPQRAVLDAFSEPEIEEINLLKSSRFGWSSILMMAMAYYIKHDPSPILMVQPRNKDAEEWSKEQVQTTIDANPVLAKLVSSAKQGSSGNTIDLKVYPGGPLRMRASNSPDGFRRYTARVAMCDEIDGYPATTGVDGNVMGLIASRVQDHWNSLIANGSTPTEKDISLIVKLFEESSVGYPFLVCPHCGGEHVRQFHEPNHEIILRGEPIPISWVSWQKGKPATATYVCPSCGCAIEQEHHDSMMRECFWRGEHWEYIDRKYKFLPGFEGRVGFSTWAGYVVSPNTSPPKLASRFIRDRANPETHKTFVNTVLGQAWVEPGEELRYQDLYNRREEYAAEVPQDVRCLTAGVDTQGNRWEMEVVGWGANREESWSIAYEIIPGDPSQDEDWMEQLLPYLEDSWMHESGVKMRLSAIGIDHGFMSKRVETFLKRLGNRHAFGFKGVPGEGKPFIEMEHNRRKRLRRQKLTKYRPELLGDFEAKLTVMKRLKVTAPGPGFCHFPDTYGEDYFQQLTAEKLVSRYVHGRASREWILLQKRNEALDCRKMAMAAFLLANPDVSREIAPKKVSPAPNRTPVAQSRTPARAPRTIRF